jgi:hypothetical protein
VLSPVSTSTLLAGTYASLLMTGACNSVRRLDPQIKSGVLANSTAEHTIPPTDSFSFSTAAANAHQSQSALSDFRLLACCCSLQHARLVSSTLTYTITYKLTKPTLLQVTEQRASSGHSSTHTHPSAVHACLLLYCSHSAKQSKLVLLFAAGVARSSAHTAPHTTPSPHHTRFCYEPTRHHNLRGL